MSFQENISGTTQNRQKEKNMSELFKGKCFRVNVQETLAIVDFDLEGERINKWDETSLRELDRVLAMLEGQKGSLSGVLFRSAKPKSFIVGADIKVIESLKKYELAVEASKFGQDVFARVEDFPLPTTVAIEGPCMGGGTEFSLACDYRVASDSAKTQIAVPEVKLGIFPGWGGTYRLPKLLELPAALDMILTGKSVYPAKARKIGLVDEVFPEGLFLLKSVEFARAQTKKKSQRSPKYSSKITQVMASNFIGRQIIFKKARETIMKTTQGHYPAPLKALEVIESMWGKSRGDWMKRERELFAELAIGEICKNLVSLFFMTEAVKKESGSALTPAEAAKLEPIREMSVLGAGVMGAGIGAQSARNNYLVFLKDVSFAAVGKGITHAKKLYDKAIQKKRMTPIERDEHLRHIRGQTDYSGFGGLDLVLEAIVEDLEVKKKVFAEVEKNVRPDCILATNTSSLRLHDIVPALQNKERFIGLHFFNPVDKMPLVEVVVTEETSPEVISRAVAYVKSIGKTPLVCKDGPGFVVNRLLVGFLFEAANLIDEGADPERIDKQLKKFGMPMGVYELLDEIGLDVGAKIQPIFERSLGPRFKSPKYLEQIAADTVGDVKRFGHKTGLGFYKWNGRKRGDFDREAIARITKADISGSKFLLSDEAVASRFIYPMINEAACVLEDKIVESPMKIDLGMIMGVGFPPFRGGLCRYADSIGLEKIVKDMDRLAAVHGIRYQPTDALKKLASEHGKFYV